MRWHYLLVNEKVTIISDHVVLLIQIVKKRELKNKIH